MKKELILREIKDLKGCLEIAKNNAIRILTMEHEFQIDFRQSLEVYYSQMIETSAKIELLEEMLEWN